MPGMDRRPDWGVIRSLFKFGLPTGVQGIAMNIGGVFLLRFIGSLEYSAAAQAAFAVDYTELFSLITWTSTGLLGAAATIAGQNLVATHIKIAWRIDGYRKAAIRFSSRRIKRIGFGRRNDVIRSTVRPFVGKPDRLGQVVR